MVIRTDILAYVATVNERTNRRSQLLRNRALQLDCEIADTPARIDHARFYNRISWARVDTTCARATSVRLEGLILLQRIIDKQRT